MLIPELIIESSQKLVTKGLTRGTWGNISVRDGNKIWLTPSGVPYQKLKPENIAAIVLSTGEQIEGNLKPTSELPLHVAIYKNFPEINAIVHTHSIYGSVFASIGEEIPCFTEDQAQIIGGSVPVAEYAFPSTEELANNAVAALKRQDRYAVLLSKHGIVSIGRNMEEAIMVAEITEKSAEIAATIFSMNKKAEPVSEEDIKKMRRLYLKSYSSKIINMGDV